MTRSNLMMLGVALATLLFIAACTAAAPANDEPSVISSPTQESRPATAEQPTATPPSPPAQAPTPTPEFTIVPLLPFDAIPAIDEPEFLSPDVADTEYSDEELVLGVEFEGDARAYSIPFLSSHEIVNDTVGGRAIAVTW